MMHVVARISSTSSTMSQQLCSVARMAWSINSQLCRRCLSTSATLFYERPRKNFRAFPLANVTGQYDYKHTPKPLLEKEFNYPLCEDTFFQRYPGYWIKGKFHYVKEMEPELIVPDLTGFKLKPYVSYRTQEVTQSPLTAKHLFNLVYADDIVKKFKNNEEIEMVADPAAARLSVKQTGADMFDSESAFSIEKDRFE